MQNKAHFGPFTIDMAAQTLLKGAETINLQPRAFELLVYFASHPDMLHSRQDLQDVLWPDVFVGDEALTQMIRRIRKALGDSPSKPLYLATVPRRGYRFVSDVTWEASTAPTQAPTTATPSASLPQEIDPFFGRESELKRLAAHRAGGARLITLLGPGGMGKTRLALRFASSNADQAGAVFMDLSESVSLEGVALAAASALDTALGDADKDAALKRLGWAMAARGPLIVVVDNFETVIAWAKETVGLWLKLAPETTFIATSRERLGLAGEAVLPIGALDQEASRNLFEQRARMAGGTLVGSETEEAAISEIVERLDHSPLAIELAAGRARMMGPSQIKIHLEKRFQLLKSRKHDGPERHRSLRVVVEDSFQRLSPAEAEALTQCSILNGPFSLEMAEGLLDLDHLEDAPWTPDVLQDLVDRSMIHIRTMGESDRAFILLESIRAYVREAHAQNQQRTALGNRLRAATLQRLRLLIAGQAPAWELSTLIEVMLNEASGDPHWLAETALVIEPWLSERGPRDIARRLLDNALEHKDNLPDHVAARLFRARAGQAKTFRGEIDILSDQAEALANKAGLTELAADSSLYGIQCLIRAGHYKEGFDALKGWRETYNLDSELITAKYKMNQAGALTGLGRNMEAQALRVEAMGHLSGLGETWLTAVLEDQMALHLGEQGRTDESIEHSYRAVSLYKTLGWQRQLAVNYTNMSTPLAFTGRFEEARRLLNEAEVIFGEIGDPFGKAAAILNRSLVEILTRNLTAAANDIRHCRELAIATDFQAVHAVSYLNEATVLWLRGQLQGADSACRRGLEITSEVGLLDRQQQLMMWRGAILAALGRPEEGAAEVAASTALLDEAVRPRTKETLDVIDLHLAAARALRDGDTQKRHEIRDQAKALLGKTGPQAGILVELLLGEQG